MYTSYLIAKIPFSFTNHINKWFRIHCYIIENSFFLQIRNLQVSLPRKLNHNKLLLSTLININLNNELVVHRPLSTFLNTKQFSFMLFFLEKLSKIYRLIIKKKNSVLSKHLFVNNNINKNHFSKHWFLPSQFKNKQIILLKLFNSRKVILKNKLLADDIQ